MTQHTDTSGLDLLSPRESRVAELVARGMTNAQIGTEVGATAAVVKAILTRIYAKLRIGPDRDKRVALAMLVRSQVGSRLGA